MAVVLLAACGAPPPLDHSGPTADWPTYAGDERGLHFSPLTQIAPANLGRLELAWSHRSGDFHAGSAEHSPTALQVTPIVANETLYYCTPFMRVFALDPETGAERWSFDPGLEGRGIGGPYPLTCRGVAYWEAERPREGKSCERRILYGTRDSELIALDADTGAPCPRFGDGGRVALREGIGPGVPDWKYYPTSPPLVIGDLAVIGALVADQLETDAPSGVVRAFDVRTGKRVWAWDPVPRGWRPDRRKPGELWQRGTPNVWAPISGDASRGLVFVPTGNPSPDSWGGLRRGIDHFGSSTVALDARTGRVVWRFQTVHHDVWDWDVPAQPQLFEHADVGDGRPAVVQPTKLGHVFLLDRETGEPLYPVEERPVPTDGVAGETLAPTQPFPTHPPPLHPVEISAENVFGFTPWDRASCRDLLARHRYDGGPFTPPSVEGSVQFPHTAGGINWGGVALDPDRALMVVNQTHVAMLTRLVPRAEFDALPAGAVQYPMEAYPMRGTPFGVIRQPFFSRFGAPCNPPPWGSLAVVDLATGEVRWRVPLGTPRDQAPFPIWWLWRDLGAPNFGGGLLTASGVFFIGATTDRTLRAFDVDTGRELWRTRIPYTANATPLSYRLRRDARQFVVVAAGGNPLTQPGDALLAFALRE